MFLIEIFGNWNFLCCAFKALKFFEMGTWRIKTLFLVGFNMYAHEFKDK